MLYSQRLDLTRHRMIYDGWITWRICRTKQLDVHAILLEDILVLLQRVPDSDKLILKSQSSSTTVASTSSQPVVMGVVAGTGAGAKEDKHTHSPIVKLTNLLLRNVATGLSLLWINVIPFEVDNDILHRQKSIFPC